MYLLPIAIASFFLVPNAHAQVRGAERATVAPSGVVKPLLLPQPKPAPPALQPAKILVAPPVQARQPAMLTTPAATPAGDPASSQAQSESRKFQTLSNASKQRHDESVNAIENMK